MRAYLAVVVAVIAVGCGSGGAAGTQPTSRPPTPTTTLAVTTTSIPGPWAHEAEAYFVSLDTAANPGVAASFFDDDAVYTVSASSLRLEGRAAIEEFFAIAGPPAEVLSAPQVYLAEDGAVELETEVRGVGEYQPGEKFLTNIFVIAFDDGLIQSYDAEWLTSWLRTAGGIRREHATQLESLYEEYVAAWDSGAEDRIQSLYAMGGSRTDALMGGSLVLGEEWAAGVAPYLLPSADDVSYEPVNRSYEPHDHILHPAVFAPTVFTEPTVAHVIFDLRTAESCPLRILAEWELDGFAIQGERLFYEVASLRRCGSVFGIASLPDGWWSGVVPPSPFVEVVTASVTTGGGQVIPVTNGEARQIELLEWGLARFGEAGLPEPELDRIGFPPSSECASVNATGLAQFDPNSAHVFMCLGEDEICVGPTCETFRISARLGLLHELSHVWEFQNVDRNRRQAFMELRGLEVWSDAQSGWAGSGEGIEHAAEILAWGLMDEPVELIRIPNSTPAELTASFELLTGRAPLGGSAQ